jgi:hypothetical protein
VLSRAVIEAGGEEQDVHAVEGPLDVARRVGFEVPDVVALALKEPGQDVLGQRVGAYDGYGCG